MLRSLARPGLVALLATLACAAPAAAAGPFATDSVWDAPLADDAAPVSNSAALVSELRRQTRLPGGTWINTDWYSVPVYTVGPHQPTVRVIADTPYPPLQDMWDAVPLPAGAQPAPGSDAHLVVEQPSTDTIWEFWAMHHEADGWHASWGARMDDASTNPGYFGAPWGATGTSLALAGGLIRTGEMAACRIDHALALALPDTSRDQVVWPAQRGDGNISGADAIPEGTRFRIDPSVDLDALHLAPAARVIAEAIQRYGMIVRDRAGAVVLYGEDPQTLGWNPWPGLFNEWPNHLLDSLPWDRMEVVEPSRAAFAPQPAPVVTPPVPAAPEAPVATPVVAEPTPVPPAPPSAPGETTPPVAVVPPVPPAVAPVATPVAKGPPAKPKAKVTAKVSAVSARAKAACAKARRRGASARAKAACRKATATAKTAARR